MASAMDIIVYDVGPAAAKKNKINYGHHGLWSPSLEHLDFKGTDAAMVYWFCYFCYLNVKHAPVGEFNISSYVMCRY